MFYSTLNGHSSIPSPILRASTVKKTHLECICKIAKRSRFTIDNKHTRRNASLLVWCILIISHPHIPFYLVYGYMRNIRVQNKQKKMQAQWRLVRFLVWWKWSIFHAIPINHFFPNRIAHIISHGCYLLDLWDGRYFKSNETRLHMMHRLGRTVGYESKYYCLSIVWKRISTMKICTLQHLDCLLSSVISLFCGVIAAEYLQRTPLEFPIWK